MPEYYRDLVTGTSARNLVLTPDNVHPRIAVVSAEEGVGSITELAEWWRSRLPSASLLTKRLSGQDTLASGRRCGWYGTKIPKEVLAESFPKFSASDRKARFDLIIDSHSGPANRCRAGVVWYNSRSRNEARFTDLVESSALLDPENTGALAPFTFGGGANSDRPVTPGSAEISPKRSSWRINSARWNRASPSTRAMDAKLPVTSSTSTRSCCAPR